MRPRASAITIGTPAWSIAALRTSRDIAGSPITALCGPVPWRARIKFREVGAGPRLWGRSGHPVRWLVVRLLGDLLERTRPEQPEASPTGADDHTLGLEGAEDAARHLSARPDHRRKQRSREDRGLPKEQVGVRGQHAQHPSPRVLVDIAVESIGKLDDVPGQDVDDV